MSSIDGHSVHKGYLKWNLDGGVFSISVGLASSGLLPVRLVFNWGQIWGAV